MCELNSKKINDSVLNDIFTMRESNYCVITGEDKKKLEEILKKNDTYNVLLDKIDKLSFDNKIKEEVKDSLDSYIDRVNVIGTYENAKFYKLGFSDAMKLVLDCIKQQ